jgi:hypothetical protein
MGDINVTSHNQSGGITTANVGQSPPSRPPRKPSRWKRVAAAVAFLAALVGILQFLGIGPVRMGDDEKSSTFNVTSHNQSGGITAGVVNVGPRPRHFTANDAQQITQAIPKGSDVTVTATMNSDEALAYAFEIYNWLKANGYPNVQGPNSAMWSQPVFGQSVRRNGDKFDVIIGTAQ